MFDNSIELLKEANLKGVFPCAAAIIGSSHTILKSVCVGNVDFAKDSLKCSLDTIFDIASLTKVVSTTAITLRFLERGLLSLDDTIDNFLTVPSDFKNIKIRHLLTHTSGISGHFLLEDCKIKSSPANIIFSKPLAYSTGTHEEYSCMGFILLGEILTAIANKPLDLLAKQEVFTPLKMYSTGYSPTQACAPTEKAPHTDAFLNGVVHDENARFLNGVSGNAGVFSSANDMARFAQMLVCDGYLDNMRFLLKRTLQLATQNYTLGMAENRGLGFKLMGADSNFFGDILSNNSFGHTGFTGTSLVIDKSRNIYIILLTNRVHPTRDNLSILRFRRLFHNSIAAEYDMWQETHEV